MAGGEWKNSELSNYEFVNSLLIVPFSLSPPVFSATDRLLVL